MNPAATTPAPGQTGARRPRRHVGLLVTRRSALYLLLGVLVVGAIPIVSTDRILEANALRNEQAHADSALRDQLQNALRELTQLGDDASTRAGDFAESPGVQRAVLRRDVPALKRLAAVTPGLSVYLRSARVAGPPPTKSIRRSVWLTLNGKRVARIVDAVPVNAKLANQLTHDAPHAASDRLVLARRGVLVGSETRLAIEGRTVRLGGQSFRGLPALVPDASGTRLYALRPNATIEASVQPYRTRVRYAAMGSFALLILVAFLFAGPILRMLGDFRRVASQATTDGLTGLANRRTFDEELALEWRRAHRIGGSLALVLLDLDDFKQINDTHGHPAGDAVLRGIGGLLGAGVRQIDLAARYGGEEFVVLVPDSELAGAERLANRLRAAIAKLDVTSPGGEPLGVTASFGVAVSDQVATPEELVAAADDALYEAKRAGKNRVIAAGATIEHDAGLGEGGLRPAGGRGARGVGRRPAKGRPDRPGAEDPA
jgi:diguanylate cyclase (GGDEF)-like protein